MPRRIALVSAAAPHGSANFRLLEEAGFELVDRSDSDASKDEDVLAAALAGAWATVAGAELYSRGVLERLPDLRVIARVGVGYDCIDLYAGLDGAHDTSGRREHSRRRPRRDPAVLPQSGGCSRESGGCTLDRGSRR